MPDENALLQPTGGSGEAQVVPVNMYTTEGAIVLVAPFPAVMADDVSVRVEGRTLTLEAGMRTAAEKDYLLHEWTYGPYRRDVEIPDGFAGNAEAILANGQLTLRIERGDTGMPSTIPVMSK